MKEIVMFTTELNENDYINEYREIYGDDAEDIINESNGFGRLSLESDFEDFISNLEYSSQNGKCVIFGIVGSWNGKHEIMPYISDDIDSAILKCISKSDDFTIKQVDDYIRVDTKHHDGQNSFTIHLLTDEAIDLCNADFDFDLTDDKYHKPIDGYLF